MTDKQGRILAHLRNGLNYTIQNRALCFLPSDRLSTVTTEDSHVGRLQDRLKRCGRFYDAMVNILGPVLSSRRMVRHLRRLLTENGPEAFILNLGSGPGLVNGRRDIVNLDIHPFDNVDVVADATDLPFEDCSVDLVLNVAMLEHVPDPAAVLKETYRVLRLNGQTLCFVPFMQPFHAAPHDYCRWTMAGAKLLFREFDEVEVGVGAGPISGALWIFVESGAILFSFGSKKLYEVLLLVLMVVFSPVKCLDWMMADHPSGAKIASGFYIVARRLK